MCNMLYTKITRVVRKFKCHPSEIKMGGTFFRYIVIYRRKIFNGGKIYGRNKEFITETVCKTE